MELWDWRAGRRLWQTPGRAQSRLAFSRDGTRLAVGGSDLRILNAADGKQIGEPFGDGADGLWFTRSGAILVTNDLRGRLTRWDTTTHRALGAPTGGIFAGDAAYSPAEDLLAFPQGQGRVLLYDPITGSTLGRSADTGGGLDQGNAELLSAAFTADGTQVLTVNRHGTIRRFPAEAGKVAEAVCARAGRSLTPQEWAAHVPALPFLEACHAR